MSLQIKGSSWKCIHRQMLPVCLMYCTNKRPTNGRLLAIRLQQENCRLQAECGKLSWDCRPPCLLAMCVGAEGHTVHISTESGGRLSGLCHQLDSLMPDYHRPNVTFNPTVIQESAGRRRQGGSWPGKCRSGPVGCS